MIDCGVIDSGVIAHSPPMLTPLIPDVAGARVTESAPAEPVVMSPPEHHEAHQVSVEAALAAKVELKREAKVLAARAERIAQTKSGVARHGPSAQEARRVAEEARQRSEETSDEEEMQDEEMAAPDEEMPDAEEAALAEAFAEYPDEEMAVPIDEEMAAEDYFLCKEIDFLSESAPSSVAAINYSEVFTCPRWQKDDTSEGAAGDEQDNLVTVKFDTENLCFNDFRRRGLMKICYAREVRICMMLGMHEIHMIVLIDENTLAARRFYNVVLGLEPLPSERYCPYPVDMLSCKPFYSSGNWATFPGASTNLDGTKRAATFKAEGMRRAIKVPDTQQVYLYGSVAKLAQRLIDVTIPKNVRIHTNPFTAHRCGDPECCNGSVARPGLWYEREAHKQILMEHQGLGKDQSSVSDVTPQ